jgi:ubiquitin fusion degradation protein 1
VLAGERAVFQPRSASFQQDVGEDIRGVLEAALLQHSCLTQGDWLSVPHGGQQYDLRICELHTEPAVSVIDTDLEAEINPSLETEEKIREEYEAAARRAAEAALATAAAAEKAEAEAAAAEQERLQREAYRLGKEQALPAEPPLGSAEPIVTCLFRFPNGSRHSRRFPLSSPLQVSRQHAWAPARRMFCCVAKAWFMLLLPCTAAHPLLTRRCPCTSAATVALTPAAAV